MTTDEALFIDNGSLSEKGKEIVAPVFEALQIMSESVRNLNIHELRLLQDNLSLMIGSFIFNEIQVRSKDDDNIMPLSDNEFINYLKNKYGESWELAPLNVVESHRITLISKIF